MSWEVDSVDLVGAFLMYSDHKRVATLMLGWFRWP